MNRSGLRKTFASMKVSVPAEIEKELLEQYSGCILDDGGHEIQYTEQDVYEQLRKRLRRYEKKSVATPDFL